MPLPLRLAPAGAALAAILLATAARGHVTPPGIPAPEAALCPGPLPCVAVPPLAETDTAPPPAAVPNLPADAPRPDQPAPVLPPAEEAGPTKAGPPSDSEATEPADPNRPDQSDAEGIIEKGKPGSTDEP